MKSSSVYALIPGLRGVASRDAISFSFEFRTPPRIEFRPLGDAAQIQARFHGMEMTVWDGASGEPVRLGTVSVAGTVGFAPVRSTLGGLSLKIVENDWDVTSDGIEFDEALFEATLQELVFAEAFETLWEPLLREGLSSGGIALAPRAFKVTDGYLVVELDTAPPLGGPAPVSETAAAVSPGDALAPPVAGPLELPLAPLGARAGASSLQTNK
jgi:hypothetical protein